MGTIDLKINNRTVVMVDFINRGLVENQDGIYIYEYTHTDIKTNVVTEGILTHRRDEGITKLASLIIQDIMQ